MKFLVDNALSPRIVAGLREFGYDAIHVRDKGMAEATDEEIFSYAVTEDRIIVSADTDFGVLLLAHGSSKPSFILFRQTDKRPARQLSYLISNLPALKKELLSGCIVVCEDDRIRIRSLPLIFKE